MIKLPDDEKHSLKFEILDIFKKYRYIFSKDLEYDVNIKITSGGIAWIKVNGQITIK